MLPNAMPHSAWWYGRAIRVYFSLSLLVSTLWILRVLLSDTAWHGGLRLAQAHGSNSSDAEIARSSAALLSGVVDEDALQLDHPGRKYSLAFTDHIYCVNKPTKLGRKGRMEALFRYMHLDVELFGGAHVDVWRDIINRDYRHALIVEDDIDFEVDAVAVIHDSLAKLRESSDYWDILYVGHCSMEEGSGATYSGGGRLFHSVHPFCLSGYTLSRSGAQKLYAYFSKGARQAHAMDVQLVALIKRNMLSSCSIHPPVVYQRRDLYPSDDGLELKVAKLLTNSAWDEALALVPRLAGWSDPLDAEYLDPAFKHIPSWMENTKIVK
ncbi:hypothetical protein LPJ61_001180 [Coemansia biformis]|uniref:Glycosyltransferase family 25 protein n=1 Tax=Coemansia biformis TaxID=1286918 RepID=A0A9W7YGH6_9FUNG|nr:hypothetical protein LPJ61_001180 [Coemansia biformis]